MTRRNVLLIVSDEERRSGRLRRDGMSFDGYFTHSSPCSPARASPYTGREMDARASSGRRSAMVSHRRSSTRTT
jgi:arylsulfatase A-like enzyme